MFVGGSACVQVPAQNGPDYFETVTCNRQTNRRADRRQSRQTDRRTGTQEKLSMRGCQGPQDEKTWENIAKTNKS